MTIIPQYQKPSMQQTLRPHSLPSFYLFLERKIPWSAIDRCKVHMEKREQSKDDLCWQTSQLLNLPRLKLPIGLALSNRTRTKKDRIILR